jgi:hypothetical protein
LRELDDHHVGSWPGIHDVPASGTRGDVAHGPERLEKVPIRMLSIIIYPTEEED